MDQQHFTTTPSQTKKLGKHLAKAIVQTRGKKRAVVIGLMGDLGGGKTTFLQGFAKGLGIKQKILSPTFVIIKRFKIQTGRFASCNCSAIKKDLRFKNFYHFDCYRIKKPNEISDLGFEGIISSAQNVVAVEWADRIKRIMPPETVWVKFEFINKNTRKITINYTKHKLHSNIVTQYSYMG